MKRHYMGFIAAFVLLDVILPKTGGCSCSRHDEIEETIIEQQTESEPSSEITVEFEQDTQN